MNAKDYFQKAISYSPKFKDAMWGLANALYYLDDFEKCFQRIRKLLRQYPKSKNALEMLIEFGKNPDLNHAVEIYIRDEINRNPDTHSLSIYMAKHYYFSGKYEDALKYLKRVLAVYPEHTGIKQLADQIQNKLLNNKKNRQQPVFKDSQQPVSIASLAI